MSNVISIAICTFNRADQLRTTLMSLLESKATLSESDEVLIIDNNSNDSTKSVVEEFSKSLPIRYFLECEQGLSSARNRAIKEFKNDVIVFFDDDISFNKSTILRYRDAFEQHPSHAIFGGRIVVEWPNCAPAWYQDDGLPLINGLIGHYDLGDFDLEYGAGVRLPYGANFALRRRVIHATGEFDTKLGLKGQEIGRGEETDYFERAFDEGFKGIYLAKAKVGHRFQLERINVAYLIQYGKEKGRASVQMDGVKPTQAYRKILGYAIRGLYQTLIGRVDRAYQCVINIGIQVGLLKYSKY